MTELSNVKYEALQKSYKLRLATDLHIGLEILHLFILDILGRNTPAAKIFSSKSEEEYVNLRPTLINFILVFVKPWS